VILLRATSVEGVVAVGNKLRESFARTAREMFATPDAVTLSVGATLFSTPPASLPAAPGCRAHCALSWAPEHMLDRRLAVQGRDELTLCDY